MRISDNIKSRVSGVLRLGLELLVMAGVILLLVSFFSDKGLIIRSSIRWLLG